MEFNRLDLTKYYWVEFTQEEIDNLKKIHSKESSLRGDHRFYSKNAWIGKLGEEAVESCFPELTTITQHFNPTKFDFYSEETGLCYEVKTKGSKSGFRNWYEFDVNLGQYQKNNNDIYIACFYPIDSSDLYVIGWVWKQDVIEVGRLFHKGDLFLGKYKVLSDHWSVAFKDLNPLSEFPG